MGILGYETGPVECRAAFTADFDVAGEIPMAQVVSQMDADRRTMAARAGMRSKYVPLRFDPATGAHQIGGRYLFDTWEDVSDYVRFTTRSWSSNRGSSSGSAPFQQHRQARMACRRRARVHASGGALREPVRALRP